jgi:hypothetical protein
MLIIGKVTCRVHPGSTISVHPPKMGEPFKARNGSGR